jgi:hypothetical protein
VVVLSSSYVHVTESPGLMNRKDGVNWQFRSATLHCAAFAGEKPTATPRKTASNESRAPIERDYTGRHRAAP